MRQTHDEAAHLRVLPLVTSVAELPGALLLVSAAKQLELHAAVLAVVVAPDRPADVLYEGTEALRALHAALDPDLVLPQLLQAQAVAWLAGVVGRASPDVLDACLPDLTNLLAAVRQARSGERVVVRTWGLRTERWCRSWRNRRSGGDERERAGAQGRRGGPGRPVQRPLRRPHL